MTGGWKVALLIEGTLIYNDYSYSGFKLIYMRQSVRRFAPWIPPPLASRLSGSLSLARACLLTLMNSAITQLFRDLKTNLSRVGRQLENLKSSASAQAEQAEQQRQQLIEQRTLIQRLKAEAATYSSKLFDKQNVLLGLKHGQHQVYLSNYLQVEMNLAELRKQYAAQRENYEEQIEECRNLANAQREQAEHRAESLQQLLEESITKPQLIAFIREIDALLKLRFEDSFYMQSAEILIEFTISQLLSLKYSEAQKNFTTQLQDYSPVALDLNSQQNIPESAQP